MGLGWLGIDELTVSSFIFIFFDNDFQSVHFVPPTPCIL